MSDISEKFLLLDDLNNIIERDEDILDSYIFHNVGTLVINSVYVRIPIDTSLYIKLKNKNMICKLLGDTKTVPTFEIECNALKDFHLLIRGE